MVLILFFLTGMSSSHMRMCNDHQRFYSIGSTCFAWKSYQRKNKQMLINIITWHIKKFYVFICNDGVVWEGAHSLPQVLIQWYVSSLCVGHLICNKMQVHFLSVYKFMWERQSWVNEKTHNTKKYKQLRPDQSINPNHMSFD